MGLLVQSVHRLTTIASAVDVSTERIVEYLAEAYGLPRIVPVARADCEVTVAEWRADGVREAQYELLAPRWRAGRWPG